MIYTYVTAASIACLVSQKTNGSLNDAKKNSGDGNLSGVNFVLSSK